MVAASFSTLSGLHCPTSRFLQTPPGLLVMEIFSSVTGSQAHGLQCRSLSPLSTRNFSPLWWQPTTSGVPYGPPNGSTSYQIIAQWWKYCGLALQEPLPSCPWFTICPSFTASPVRGKSNLIADSLSCFQFQHFCRLAPHADSNLTQIPQQLLSNLDLRCWINASST